jgi:hypothetical protein
LALDRWAKPNAENPLRVGTFPSIAPTDTSLIRLLPPRRLIQISGTVLGVASQLDAMSAILLRHPETSLIRRIWPMCGSVEAMPTARRSWMRPSLDCEKSAVAEHAAEYAVAASKATS